MRTITGVVAAAAGSETIRSSSNPAHLAHPELSHMAASLKQVLLHLVFHHHQATDCGLVYSSPFILIEEEETEVHRGHGTSSRSHDWRQPRLDAGLPTPSRVLLPLLYLGASDTSFLFLFVIPVDSELGEGKSAGKLVLLSFGHSLTPALAGPRRH